MLLKEHCFLWETSGERTGMARPKAEHLTKSTKPCLWADSRKSFVTGSHPLSGRHDGGSSLQAAGQFSFTALGGGAWYLHVSPFQCLCRSERLWAALTPSHRIHLCPKWFQEELCHPESGSSFCLTAFVWPCVFKHYSAAVSHSLFLSCCLPANVCWCWNKYEKICLTLSVSFFQICFWSLKWEAKK